jgi:hypothetical protein
MAEEKRQEYIQEIKKCLSSKWETDLVSKKGRLYSKCSLCFTYKDHNTGSCGECPIKLATGKSWCQGTPVIEALYEVGWIDGIGLADYSIKRADIVKREIEFLRSLVTHLEAGYDLETLNGEVEK